MKLIYRAYKAVDFVNSKNKKLKVEHAKEKQKDKKEKDYIDCLSIDPPPQVTLEDCITHFIRYYSEDDIKEMLDYAVSKEYLNRNPDTHGFTVFSNESTYSVKDPLGRQLIVDKARNLPYGLWIEIAKQVSVLGTLVIALLALTISIISLIISL